MDQLREWIGWFGALAALIAFLIAVILVVIAAGLLIGVWPLGLLVAAGALWAFARWAAGIKD